MQKFEKSTPRLLWVKFVLTKSSCIRAIDWRDRDRLPSVQVPLAHFIYESLSVRVEPVTCSKDCLSSLSYLAEAVSVGKETWPLNLLDAAGKPGPGIRFGLCMKNRKLPVNLTLLYPQVCLWRDGGVSDFISIVRHLYLPLSKL